MYNLSKAGSSIEMDMREIYRDKHGSEISCKINSQDMITTVGALRLVLFTNDLPYI